MDFLSHWLSPLGGITLCSDGDALTGLWFDGQKHFGAGADLTRAREAEDLSVFRMAREWLEIYFSGRDPGFTPPLRLAGSPWRRAVWDVLLSTPYGTVLTYGALARRAAASLGAERCSARAAGGAVGHNPVSLIVPCHRVVTAAGGVGGYAGGAERKAWLLRLENTDIPVPGK